MLMFLSVAAKAFSSVRNKAAAVKHDRGFPNIGVKTFVQSFSHEAKPWQVSPSFSQG